MSRATTVSVEDLFKRLGETPMTRSARADSLFRRLRETEEDEFLGSFIRAPKKRTVIDALPPKVSPPKAK